LGIMGGANVVYRQILDVTRIKNTENKDKPDNGDN